MQSRQGVSIEDVNKSKNLEEICHKIGSLYMHSPDFKRISELGLSSGDVSVYNNLVSKIDQSIHPKSLKRTGLICAAGASGLLFFGSIGGIFVGLMAHESYGNSLFLASFFSMVVTEVAMLNWGIKAEKYYGKKLSSMQQSDPGFLNQVSSDFFELREQSQYLLDEIAKRESWSFDAKTAKRLHFSIPSVKHYLKRNISAAENYEKLVEQIT